jgi:hypothetical protein
MRSALKEEGAGPHLYIDSFSPSFMVDDIGHTENDPWHYDGVMNATPYMKMND